MFKVGDKVYVVTRGLCESYTEVTIVSISPKRGDIKVVFPDGIREAVYGSNGWLKGRDAWSSNRIIEITTELREKVFKIKNTRYVNSLLDSFVKQTEADIEDILMLKQVIRSTNWFKNRKVE